MITIKSNIGIPKYKQIINSIEESIVSGALKKGDRIPSINEIKNKHKLSRDTVLMAFNELKNRGVIQSIVGKGYYISSENVNVRQKIFLLFDELNAFKEDLYNALKDSLGEAIELEIYFHHFNKDIFKKLILDNVGNYSYYVIMPANLKNTKEIIDNLPSEKVFVLDQMHHDLSAFPAVYQNFEKALYNNLKLVKHRIENYQRLYLVNNENKQPKGMLSGFTKFCKDNDLEGSIVENLKDKLPKSGDLYIIPDDKNLLRIIKKMKEVKLVLSKDIGIISYNDTLLKELVEGGITTISTDFNTMGKRLAEMILNKEHKQIENPNKLIIRNSL
ncbi:GntR family transcriptional regulator [Seonamhaeicola sp. ML3]|uniref:GntR family transcriptional regulator n=1 Tax=Seonamhaeicola sp. ML3 TaxID=2937786 RepID=UPI00200BAB3B|nr:GntR family transcriptional regulator [Seonamhaeicola sp. ML3]